MRSLSMALEEFTGKQKGHDDDRNTKTLSKNNFCQSTYSLSSTSHHPKCCDQLFSREPLVPCRVVFSYLQFLQRK
jgi:hypothetical protein